MQNLYIYYKMLFYVLSYDKERETRNGKEKHIARFLDIVALVD